MEWTSDKDSPSREVLRFAVDVFVFTGKFLLVVCTLFGLPLFGLPRQKLPVLEQESAYATLPTHASEPLSLAIELPEGELVLGAPIEWSLVLENRGEVALTLATWAQSNCTDLWHTKAVNFSVIDHRGGDPLAYRELFAKPPARLPGPLLAPGERLELSCDLALVFPLERVGSFRLDVDVSIPFTMSPAENDGVGEEAVYTTVPRSDRSEFVIRRLTASQVVSWQERAAAGDVTANRVVGVHRGP